MANKRTHCMRCGNQGIRAERDGKEIYTCQALGHGVIASYDIPAIEAQEAAEPKEQQTKAVFYADSVPATLPAHSGHTLIVQQQQPEPEKSPETNAGDEHGAAEN